MSRYDSLSNVVQSASDSTVKTTSIFQEEYRYARVCLGKDHTSARNHAIDYHRQYTAREATDHWDDQKHLFEDERQTSALDLVLFNQLVQRLHDAGDEQERKFLYAVCRLEELDQYYNDQNLLRSVEILGDFEPEKIGDIVLWMGFKPRANGSSGKIPELRRKLAKLAESLWGRPNAVEA